MNSQTKEPTMASTWQAVAGSAHTDQFLEWPADLFIVTNVILERRVKRTRFASDTEYRTRRGMPLRRQPSSIS